MKVTLNGIKRRGLTNWQARERWIGRTVRIWSAEHGAYWRAGAAGYTTETGDAGLWEFSEAYDRTKHCGPEKRIEFVTA